MACILFLCQVIQKPSLDNKHRMGLISKRVAESVSEIVHAGELLKGTDCVLVTTIKLDSFLCRSVEAAFMTANLKLVVITVPETAFNSCASTKLKYFVTVNNTFYI